MEKKNQPVMGETVISMQKILANLKTFWWICLLTIALSVVLVGYQTVKTYRMNQAAQYKDSYVGSAVLYLSSDNDKDMRAYAAILASTDTKQKLTNALEQAGMTGFSSATDSLSIGSQSDSTAFGLTVLSIGKERTEILLENVTDVVLDQAANVMGVEADLLSSGVVKPCLWFPDGSFRTLSDESQRRVTLSLSDFLSWKKIIIVCAGAFLGVAAIFAAVLFDNKVRSGEELQSSLPIPYFGRWKGKESAETGRVLFAVKGYVSSRKMAELEKGIVLLALNEISGMEEIRASVQEALGVKTTAGMQSASWAGMMETAMDSAGVIIVVALNRDNMNQVKNLISQLEIAGIPLLGCMTD